jgi:hypothetical protein
VRQDVRLDADARVSDANDGFTILSSSDPKRVSLDDRVCRVRLLRMVLVLLPFPKRRLLSTPSALTTGATACSTTGTVSIILLLSALTMTMPWSVNIN